MGGLDTREHELYSLNITAKQADSARVDWYSWLQSDGVCEQKYTYTCELVMKTTCHGVIQSFDSSFSLWITAYTEANEVLFELESKSSMELAELRSARFYCAQAGMNFTITVLSILALIVTTYRRIEIFTVLSLTLVAVTSFYAGIVNVKN